MVNKIGEIMQPWGAPVFDKTFSEKLTYFLDVGFFYFGKRSRIFLYI